VRPQNIEDNSAPTFMGRSSPLVDVCKHMPRSAEPSSRGYASAESQAVRNATCQSRDFSQSGLCFLA